MDNLLPRCNACGNSYAFPAFVDDPTQSPDKVPVCPNCRTPLISVEQSSEPTRNEKDADASGE